MPARRVTTAVLLAAALVTAPLATTAVADSGSGRDTVRSGTGHRADATADREVAKAERKAERLEAKAAKRRNFCLGGTVTAIDAAAGTLTFTVHGGRYKALRGTDVAVTVAADAKVTRHGAATLADVVVGDKVRVKSRDFAVTGTKHAELLVSAVVHRVAAASRDDARSSDDSTDDSTRSGTDDVPAVTG